MRNTLFHIICALYITLYLAANIMSVRVVCWRGVSLFDAGTFVFPLTFFLSELTTELYGRRTASRMAWTTLACQALFTCLIWLCTCLRCPPEMVSLADAYNRVFAFVPRITLASLVAFICGQLTNIHILSSIKQHWGGPVWVRTISSSILGYLIDATIFESIAFGGVLPMAELVRMIGVIVIISLSVEICFSTPMTCLAVRWVRQAQKNPSPD